MLDYALSVFNVRHFVTAVAKAKPDELRRTAEKFRKTAATLHDCPDEKYAWSKLADIITSQLTQLEGNK